MTRRKKKPPVRLVTIVRAERVADGTARILGSEHAASALREMIGDKDREHVVALFLNARHQILAAEIVAIGTLTSCLVHPREMFKGAILHGAAAIICGHNHPSGDASASQEDMALIQRLTAAGRLLGIELLDFLIVTPTTSWSGREMGKML